MSYLVLARKWRPLSFEDVIGQEHITNTLKKAIEKNRVAHAYVFTGTRGVGKTTTARILARALNCENGPTPNPCGVCESCKNIISGSSFDVLEIDGASNNKVDDIRDLRDNVSYSSMGGKFRVFVIDEVHMLTKQAFNALLKTLEEPPKSVIFIFATTEPYKIPETILSRCQRYDFRRISTGQILSRLEHICTSENISFDSKALVIIARKAEGSMRDALSLLDQVYSFCHDSLEEKEVRSVLGLVDSEIYSAIIDAIAKKDPAPVLASVQNILDQGFDLHEFIVGLEEHIRNLLFCRFPEMYESRRIDMPLDSEGRPDLYRTQSQLFSESDLLRMSEIVRKAEFDLKWSAFPRFLVEIMLLKLVNMDSSVSVEELITALKSSPSNTGPSPKIPSGNSTEEGQKKKDNRSIGIFPGNTQQAVSGQPPAKTVSSLPPHETKEEFSKEERAQLSPSALKELWPKFLDSLMQDRPNLCSFLSFATIVSATGSSLDLRFPYENQFQFNDVIRKERREEIEKKLENFAGAHIDLHITLEPENPSQKPGNFHHAFTAASPSLDDEIEREPIIKTVMELFDGELLT
ncbi:MAG: DNA polymerase III subunit gamma/tau [Chitinivibrionales bacterium]|nr:DNA polymerase III subunit gamma/tau [Chitinivibrionales bacterium]